MRRRPTGAATAVLLPPPQLQSPRPAGTAGQAARAVFHVTAVSAAAGRGERGGQCRHPRRGHVQVRCSAGESDRDGHMRIVNGAAAAATVVTTRPPPPLPPPPPPPPSPLPPPMPPCSGGCRSGCESDAATAPAAIGDTHLASRAALPAGAINAGSPPIVSADRIRVLPSLAGAGGMSTHAPSPAALAPTAPPPAPSSATGLVAKARWGGERG